MKKTITLFVLFCSVVSTAQTYYRMLKDSNIWYVSGQITIKGIGNHYKTTSNGIGEPCLGQYRAYKDSILNNKTYKIFDLVKAGQKCNPFSSDPFKPLLIREDSVLKKVYVVPHDSIVERVAMDFGMAIGDSLYLIYPATNQRLISGYYKLDSIKTINEMVGPRKHFYLSTKSAATDLTTRKRYIQEWVESIGSLHFPVNFMQESTATSSIKTILPLHATCFKQQFGPFVTCKFSDGVQYYHDQCSYQWFLANPKSSNVISTTCNFYNFTLISGINVQRGSTRVRLYPNPADRYLRFEFEDKNSIAIVRFINNTGTIVMESQINPVGQDIQLDVTHLPPGIYSVRVLQNGNAKTDRFLKQ